MKDNVNTQYKDRLFKRIFKKKKDLLELYNAVNNTNYDNPEELEVNTLEDAVYMRMKNDVSFVIKDVLNLYEHQSTFSPNLPLRGLFYFSSLYKKMVGGRGDIYSRRIIALPYPQFIVFYNGTEKEPAQQVLELSDAFPEWADKENAALQCRAVVVNINLGYNMELMEKCKMLKEYAQFIAMIREHLATGRDVAEAVDAAIAECIRQGILEQILREEREEVRSMILTEYDEQAHIKSEKEISYEEGKAEGLKEGREEGEDALAKLIQRLQAEERAGDVSKVLSDREYRKKIMKEYNIL
ncbi:MAG: hypothetical protein IKU39_00630 [Lachnospiraceae bacterium]|nr:hypothetical protein [Lachnospiraceae bacterium]